MIRRLNFYSICFAFGLSVLLILAGSRYTDNPNYQTASEDRRNIRNFLKIEEGEEGLAQSSPTSVLDSSLNIEEKLEKTRQRIQNELRNYNFTYSGVNNLDDLLMEAGGRPMRSMIISTWRSGTTFLGEVLNSMPGNFYHYEPLLKYEIIQIRGPPHAEKALSTLHKMFNCDYYDDMDDYFEYGRTHMHQFSHNTRLWDQCKFKKELCSDAEFTSRLCKLFPFQSMKVVRVRLRLVEEILKDKELNIKVVLLIRDPRGVMQSRQHRVFCKPSPDCWQPELLCADMISDYVAAGRLLQNYSNRLLVLRYEELASDPTATTQRIFEFLRLSAGPAVDKFLRSHTTTDVAGVSSTFRVSRDVPFKWRNVLDFDYVQEIQTACQEAMDLWGYQLAHNASHMTSKDFNPLTSYSITP